MAGLTPDQAADLVKHFGGGRKAARGAGIPQSTLRYWLDPDPVCERMQRTHEALSGVAYNRRLLQMRRQKALLRMAERMKEAPSPATARSHPRISPGIEFAES